MANSERHCSLTRGRLAGAMISMLRQFRSDFSGFDLQRQIHCSGCRRLQARPSVAEMPNSATGLWRFYHLKYYRCRLDFALAPIQRLGQTSDVGHAAFGAIETDGLFRPIRASGANHAGVDVELDFAIGESLDELRLDARIVDWREDFGTHGNRRDAGFDFFQPIQLSCFDGLVNAVGVADADHARRRPLGRVLRRLVGSGTGDAARSHIELRHVVLAIEDFPRRIDRDHRERFVRPFRRHGHIAVAVFRLCGCRNGSDLDPRFPTTCRCS